MLEIVIDNNNDGDNSYNISPVMHSGCFPAYSLIFSIPVTLLRTSNQKKKKINNNNNNNNNRLYKKNLNFLIIIIFNPSQNSAFYYLILHRNLHFKNKKYEH